MLNQRDKNRLREHGPDAVGHGWKQKETPALGGENNVLMECPCGWTGWVNKDVLSNTG